METATLTKTNKPAHFNAFLEKLVAQFKPLQIYLYAELKKQELCNSIFCNVQAQEQDIYYLLIVTEGSVNIENDIQQYADVHYKEGRAIIHSHGQETLKQNLNERNGYFSSVLKYGQMLYNIDNALYLDEVLSPNPKKWLGKAITYWRTRSQIARGFLQTAELALENNHDHVSLFLLHQATEQACVGLIWVFMGYKSDKRNLKRLLYICGCFSGLPLQHFMGTIENEKLLSMMMKSFSQARYKDDFSLEGKSGYQFLELVISFLDMADQLCKERFDALENQLAEKVEKVSEENYD